MQPTEPTTPPFFDEPPDLGDIKINHNVIAGIVRLAAIQVPGVANVGGGIVDGITEIFAKRESDHRGVKVSEENDTYRIEVRLVIAYGSEIGRTAYEVQVAVRKQVIAMTGKDVRQVDVIIEGVRLPGDATATRDRQDDTWPENPESD
jgi:uncharacterized alkaline shock family protein YloU